jgi:hypothetical protein
MGDACVKDAVFTAIDIITASCNVTSCFPMEPY